MRYIKLIIQFLIASSQQEMAYSFNFFIHLVYSLLNPGVGLRINPGITRNLPVCQRYSRPFHWSQPGSPIRDGWRDHGR
jgi:hypothetical protein